MPREKRHFHDAHRADCTTWSFVRASTWDWRAARCLAEQPQSLYGTPRGSPLKAPSLRQLRCYAIARSLFQGHQPAAGHCAPGLCPGRPDADAARDQDLILAQRVKDYRAGELERRYPRLRGVLRQLRVPASRDLGAAASARGAARVGRQDAGARQYGRTHPKEVQAHFHHGRIKRWGGDLNAIVGHCDSFRA